MRRSRRSVVVAAALLASLLAPLAAPGAAAAAAEDYVTGAATYTVDQAAGVVHVVVDMTFEDIKPDTSTTFFFFTGYTMAVQPEATNVRVSHGSTAFTTKQLAETGYLRLDIAFPSRVLHGHTQAFQVRYDLPDEGPRSEAGIRIAPGVAAFYAWSYGQDKASVRILLPGDCQATTSGDPLVAGQQGGQVVLTASAIRDRTTWLATILASCPDQLTTTTSAVAFGGSTTELDLHAFPDDPIWETTVRADLTRGLPLLDGLVGLPWPVDGPLDVTEAYTPSLGGYAGFYEPPQSGSSTAHIQIGEDPAPLVVIHEASHAWFNDHLFQERWINEGLANEYASLVLPLMGDPAPAPDPVTRSATAAFPLETWQPPAVITDPSVEATEAYGYAASWTLMRQLVTEIGPDRMRLVLQAAAAHRIPYAGRPTPELMRPATDPTDWRGFLDLLEQVGGASDADALFSTWVVPDADAAMMASHAAAAARYAALVRAGDGWLPGYGVRLPLAQWDFALASTRMDQAQAVLVARDALDQQAADLGLMPPGALQESYEDADGDVSSAQALAADELATVAVIATAQATVDGDHDPFVVVGLIGSAPQGALDAARRDFSAGGDVAARADAATALATISQATAIGQERVAIAVILILVLLVLLVLGVRRRQRRRGLRLRLAGAALAAGTLADYRQPARSAEPAEPAVPPDPAEGPPP